jgi:hypothetical protein
MDSLNKSLKVLYASFLFWAVVVVPASSGASAIEQKGLQQVAMSLEAALPAIASAADYRSASDTAFLLATARSRLDQRTAACGALSQSLEYYRKALEHETGKSYPGVGINETSDGMAIVRAKFGCTQGRSA